jgi:hypothetical protein
MARAVGRPPAARTPAQVWRAVVGLAVAAAVGVFIGVQVAGPSAAESAVASLREQEARRDLAQITELTARTRQTARTVQPVVDALTANAAPAATDAQVAAWKQALDKEMQWYAETVSGTTATNVARGAFRTAVQQLATAVDLFAAVRAAQQPQQTPLLQLVIRQRDLAVIGWSVAATQLDQINVDAGNGHQHVYLNTSGGPGVMTGDTAPEGVKR